MVAEPVTLLTDVKMRVPVDSGLVYSIVGCGMTLGLAEMAETMSAWFSLLPPALMPVRLTMCGPVSSLTNRLAIGSSVGWTFGGTTVRTKLSDELAPSASWTV